MAEIHTDKPRPEPKGGRSFAIRNRNREVAELKNRLRASLQAARIKYGADDIARVSAEITKNGDQLKLLSAPDLGEAIAAYGSLKDYSAKCPLSG